MGLRRRLEKLEDTNAGPCEECGHAPGATVEGYVVEWADVEEPEPVEPEFCGKCGRQLVYVVTWGDDPGGGS